jgi:hypothetical protein
MTLNVDVNKLTNDQLGRIVAIAQEVSNET